MSKGKGGVRNQPTGNTGVSAPISISRLENDPAFYDRATERAYIFNPDGSLYRSVSQHDEFTIMISSEEMHGMENMIFVHNHPIPSISTMPRSGLSQGDVYLTARYNMKEVRATNVKGTHVLTRGKGGWGDMSKVEDAMNRTRNYRSIHDGSWVRDFAKKVGAHYAFIPR